MRTKLALSCLLCLGILLLAGCGYNGTATPTTAGSSTTVTAVTPGAITPSATTAATVAPSGSRSGHVTMKISASSYHSNDTIVVTITNGTSQPISFADHQSNCTIVLLQRQDGPSWQQIGQCRLMIATRFLSLDAGKSETVSLKAPTTLWQKGTYRVTFTYGVAVLYSSLFQIN